MAEKLSDRPINRGRFRRLLMGHNYAFWTGVVCMCGAPALLISYLHEGKDPIESVKSAAAAFCVCLVITLVFSFRPLRVYRLMRRLRRFGELDAALSDLNSENVYFIPFTFPEPDNIAKGNVLGERYIFLFSTGRVIRYYQIKSLAVSRVENHLQLNITDRFDKAYSIIETSGDRIPDIARCYRQLKLRYPGCPDLSRSDQLIINI